MKSVVAVLAVFSLTCAGALPQNQPPAAGVGVEFEVASVKPNTSGDRSSWANFPLGPGTVYYANGGHFSGVNQPLWVYILFAYKLRGIQAQFLLSQMPDWVTGDRFDIQARTDGDPAKDTKEQMRLMMRSLLADRFGLALHTEPRRIPVFGLVPLKPGSTGPFLQPHSEEPPCTTAPPPREDQMAGRFPALCGGILPMPHGPSVSRFGARNVSMAFIANALTETGAPDRPVLDRTELGGAFDLSFEFVPEVAAPHPADLEPPAGPTFLEALKEQLGLRLEPQKGDVEVVVLDRVQHPSSN